MLSTIYSHRVICTNLSNVRNTNCAQQLSTLFHQHGDAANAKVAHHSHRVKHGIARMYRNDLGVEV